MLKPLKCSELEADKFYQLVVVDGGGKHDPMFVETCMHNNVLHLRRIGNNEWQRPEQMRNCCVFVEINIVDYETVVAWAVARNVVAAPEHKG